VLSVTSAMVGAAPVTTTTWTVVNPVAGVVASSVGYGFTGTYTVTYVAGRNPVPPELEEAALLRVQHSYETQRGAADSAFSDQADGSTGGGSFVLILRARDLEAAYVLPTVA
jgi:hypothetical protein